MTSIDQLRETLGARATAVDDHGVAARRAAVHARVGVVRRRRRALATGGVVAAVVLAAGGVALLDGGTQRTAPAPATTVVGLTPPATLSSLGYTYDLTEGIDGHDGTVRVVLPASDQPRLVSWATSGRDAAVTLSGPSFAIPLEYSIEDFGDFHYVSPGGPETLVVTAAEGDPGVAVYTLGTARPPGFTQDGVTFRQAPAGYELLGAQVAAPGQGEVTVAATAPTRGVALRYYCTGGPADAYLHVQTGDDPGDLSSGSGCDGTAPVDAFGGSGSEFATRAGADATTRFWVTAGEDGPVVDDPDLRLGLGVYARTDGLRPGTTDATFPQRLEDRGHVWRLVTRHDTTGSPVNGRGTPAGAVPVLARTYADIGEGAVRTRTSALQGRSDVTSELSAGSGVSHTELVNVGGGVQLDITDGDVAPDDLLVIGFYKRADGPNAWPVDSGS